MSQPHLTAFMAFSTGEKPPNIDLDELKGAIDVLELLNHRNKNQHRRSTWWKWFSILRRSVSNIFCIAQQKDQIIATAQIAYMRDFVLPNCYLYADHQVAWGRLAKS